MIVSPGLVSIHPNTLHYLIQLQLELRKMLRNCAISEPFIPKHSLYSSQKVYRTDELHLGLRGLEITSAFSAN